MTDVERPLEVLVHQLTEETDDVLRIDLRRVDGEPFPAWTAGAHIDVRIPALGIERQYSLCGSPTQRRRWTIAVLRERDGRGGSAWLHEALAVGDVIGIHGPRNHFALVESPEYVFVAGGIGITPILPMIEQAESQGSGWRLYYGGRTARTMAFADRLLAEHPDRVVVWPQDVHGLLDLDAILAAPADDARVYCCGPEPLLAAVEQRCASWPRGSLHVERFAPRPGAMDGPSAAFEVIAERSGASVHVEAGQSIVDALASVGISVPTSCREGTCGTCETEVLEGEIDHRDSFLSAEEREEGATMMVCCSRAAGQRLVLDL